MNISVLLLALLVLQISVVFGAVSFSEIKKERIYGRMVRYCEYKELKLLPRSKIKDYDSCEKCVCRRRGLDCATLPGAFRINVPSDSKCISVLIGCKAHWVLRNNNNKKCPENLIPQQISMVGK